MRIFSVHLILLDCFLGAAASCILFVLIGEFVKSSRLSVSFLDSLIGDKGVLMLSLPELRLVFLSENENSFVGEVGDLGDLFRGDLESDGDSGGANGDEGEKTDSSLGVRSILMIGGPASADLDLFPSLGEGDRERRTLRDPKQELLDRGI